MSSFGFLQIFDDAHVYCMNRARNAGRAEKK